MGAISVGDEPVQSLSAVKRCATRPYPRLGQWVAAADVPT